MPSEVVQFLGSSDFGASVTAGIASMLLPMVLLRAGVRAVMRAFGLV